MTEQSRELEIDVRGIACLAAATRDREVKDDEGLVQSKEEEGREVEGGRALRYTCWRRWRVR